MNTRVMTFAGVLFLACARQEAPVEQAEAAPPVQQAAAAATTEPAPEPAPAPAPRPRDGALPASLQSDIDDYKGLFNRGRYAEGMARLREFIPRIQEYVDAHPTHAEGQLELSAAYASAMIIGAQKMPPGEAMDVILEGVRNDYVGKARRALTAFERYADPNDHRLSAAAEMRRYLDEIDTKARAK